LFFEINRMNNASLRYGKRRYFAYSEYIRRQMHNWMNGKEKITLSFWRAECIGFLREAMMWNRSEK